MHACYGYLFDTRHSPAAESPTTDCMAGPVYLWLMYDFTYSLLETKDHLLLKNEVSGTGKKFLAPNSRHRPLTTSINPALA